MPRVAFDEASWSEIIQKPDWYLDYDRFAHAAQDELGEESEPLKKLSKQVRHFFEGRLADGKVALASDGPDWDSQRQPIDTVVIHHTSAKPGYRLPYMNAVQLLNVYAHYYANPVAVDGHIKGRPIWSNHLDGGQQVFYLYHWLMRMDGSFERLLEDDQIGWHAGNWEINKRSIGICLDNDYENQDPPGDILEKLADFIKQNYSGIKPENIIGHCEARAGTICPGSDFLDGWKPLLLEYL